MNKKIVYIKKIKKGCWYKFRPNMGPKRLSNRGEGSQLPLIQPQHLDLNTNKLDGMRCRSI